MLGWGGGDVNVPCTCTHVGCYAYGTLSEKASLEAWKIVIHKATLIRKTGCSMCIDGNGADLVTLICSQVWVKPVKSCADSLRNFCPEKVLSQKCLPLWRNVQNWQFFDDPYRSLASNSNKSKKENIKRSTVSAGVHSKLWMTMSWNARPLGERDTMFLDGVG